MSEMEPKKDKLPSEQPKHPIVIDVRTNTVYGKPGDVVVLEGEEVFVISARLPINETIVYPAGYNSVQVGFKLPRKDHLIKRAVKNIGGGVGRRILNVLRE